MTDHRIDWQVGLGALGPDDAVFVGVPDWDGSRGTFPVADEGAQTLLVLEITSPSTRANDLEIKVDLYWRCGVPLYAIVDRPPELGGNTIRILGYRATADGYEELTPNDNGRVWLETVELWLAGEEGRAVCYTATGERLPEHAELVAAVNDALARLAAAEAAAAQAEAAAAQAEAAAAQAEAAAVTEKARADAEAAARQAVLEENEALRRRLALLEAELQKRDNPPS